MEFAWVSWVVIGGAVGYVIGSAKDRPLAGTLWGTLFGPIAWLVVWIEGTKYECPECASDIRKHAKRCPQCQANLVAEGA